MSTVTFNLKVLFNQYQRFINKWSYPNDQLDLAKYKGCKFTFYRHPEVDFLAQYDQRSPYENGRTNSPKHTPRTASTEQTQGKDI